ncbi:MAG: hypothetical protein JWM87_3500, partial [Candidatus Eremiobacteraeota bacterium]|nr:hypothetical protein [Candidatus Eremiobacteraeota bacterium]
MGVTPAEASPPRHGWDLPRAVAPDGFTASAHRVCIVTGELAGPDFNGGIGTANRGLALALRRAGFAVDVLYTRVEDGRACAARGTFAEHVARLRERGIRLLCIENDGPWDAWLSKSYAVLAHLLRERYAFVFFNDCHGNAYHALLAKRSGNRDLAATQMCVVTHSATQWIYDLNRQPVAALAELAQMEVERRSLELADAVISPSRYLTRKYEGYGWRLPELTYVHPNLLPQASRARAELRRANRPVRELVFFGRLETRKGLWLFCEAIERVKYELCGTAVTFLGKFTEADGVSTGVEVVRRTAGWPMTVTFLPAFDQEQALEYLRGAGRVAVMPSLEDNSPCVIQECLNESIPFVASGGSGGEELVDAADRGAVLFEPTVRGLIAKLREVVSGGAATALPSFDPAESEARLVRWVGSRIAAASASEAAAPAPRAAAPR